MYTIISQGALVAFCTTPRYVRLNDNGIYVEATPEEAIALSVNGDLYNINGGNAIPDAPEAVVKKYDAAEYIFQSLEKVVADVDFLAAMAGVEL